MKPSDILQSAHDLIDSPEKWTQGSVAKDKNNCLTYVDNGVCWCAIGAIMRVGVEADGYEQAKFYLLKDAKKHGYSNIVQANDDLNTTWKQVRAAFRRAIREAKENGE